MLSLEREKGLEPSTLCLEGRCSASALINQISEMVFQSMQSSDPFPS